LRIAVDYLTTLGAVEEENRQGLIVFRSPTNQIYEIFRNELNPVGSSGSPIAFNIFMQQEIARIKRQNPGINNTEAHRIAKNAWFDRFN